MTTEPQFRPFHAADHSACLALFDENCPDYFAPDERDEYAQFLDARPGDYQVCILDDRVVGSYGLHATSTGHAALHWILFSPTVHGRGLGLAVMSRVLYELKERGASVLEISASHKSAAFFAKFGAVKITTTPDGWGPGMHRVNMVLEL